MIPTAAPTPEQMEMAVRICGCDSCSLTDGMYEGDPEYAQTPCRRNRIASALSQAVQAVQAEKGEPTAGMMDEGYGFDPVCSHGISIVTPCPLCEHYAEQADTLSRLQAENEELRKEVAEAWEAARPVSNCGFVGEGDGCCEHPKAQTAECHGGVICPVAEERKVAEITSLRSQLSEAEKARSPTPLAMKSAPWDAGCEPKGFIKEPKR